MYNSTACIKQVAILLLCNKKVWNLTLKEYLGSEVGDDQPEDGLAVEFAVQRGLIDGEQIFQRLDLLS